MLRLKHQCPICGIDVEKEQPLKDLENIFVLKNMLYNILNVEQERINKIGLTDKEEKKEA
jgi:hypothetical protein